MGWGIHKENEFLPLRLNVMGVEVKDTMLRMSFEELLPMSFEETFKLPKQGEASCLLPQAPQQTQVKAPADQTLSATVAQNLALIEQVLEEL